MKKIGTLLLAAIMMVVMLPAMEVKATDSGVVDRFVIWADNDNSTRYDSNTGSFNKDLPDGVTYDNSTGTLTLDNASVDTITYKGTKDLAIHVKGTSSLETLIVDDEGKDVCYHGGDVIIYGDGKNRSTLNTGWIRQETNTGGSNEPDADDGDLYIRDLTINGNLIESTISNLSIESSNITLKGRSDSDGDWEWAYISTGGAQNEHSVPKGLLTVKDSVIKLTGNGSYIRFIGYALNGEHVYTGSNRAEREVNLDNSFYSDYYDISGGYIMITPETIDLTEPSGSEGSGNNGQDAKAADLAKTKPGTVASVAAGTVKVLKNVSGSTPGTVVFTKAKNKKSVTVPATVTINKKTFKVTQIGAKAFTGKKIKTVTVGANVNKMAANAFKGSKATKIIVKTKLLKKTSIKKSLKGSKVTKVQVKVGSKKVNKKYVKTYKKIFTKKITGKKVKVSL